MTMEPMNLRIFLALLLLAAPAAHAQEQLGTEHVELTPFFGYRIGGHFRGGPADFPFEDAVSYGGLADINLTRDNFKLELLWSRQSTHLGRAFQGEPRKPLQIDHFQAGILQEVGIERARLAVSALAGGSRFAAPGLGSETRFSGSIGGIGKVFATSHVGLRLDARLYGVYVKDVAGAFCGSGTCAFAYSGNMLWQSDFTAGLIIAF